MCDRSAPFPLSALSEMDFSRRGFLRAAGAGALTVAISGGLHGHARSCGTAAPLDHPRCPRAGCRLSSSCAHRREQDHRECAENDRVGDDAEGEVAA